MQGLENYTLLEKMGDGAFSNVFKAMDNRVGRKVAVKVVRKYELNTTQVSSVPEVGTNIWLARIAWIAVYCHPSTEFSPFSVVATADLGRTATAT